MVWVSLGQPGAARGNIEPGQMCSDATKQISQQQSSVLSQRQTSVLSQQQTSVLSQQKTSIHATAAGLRPAAVMSSVETGSMSDVET